jgi:hypothetical protein
LAATLTLTVRLVELFRVTELTVTPLPENTTVAPDAKFVPATVKFWLVAPCARELGVTEDTVGPAVTVNPPVRVALPPSGFFTVTSRAPVVAFDATLTLTVRLVELLRVTELTVTPLPENVTVTLDAKFVPATVKF